ncbi:GIY-YIG nuclease family protein [Affinibrenneria salicis]|uniref:GIY-YIG nuclease family protein n=1 Tax=Affinibrenneria salicis TaxID=2590031 RepID=A0A5J5G6C1_9GAMM|nr:GIY-YIG nuclease family protein [Affinibrenneria salicis]KAA9002729.1 GIY-YIG nuclease family protein [Affinibrenneria salicis]KAA9002984.1 GIY-YIG nuclease family protein [Affinibrenneria salicis]
MTDGNDGDRWYLYMVQTARGALYTGITTDVRRRVAQHQNGKGAKALRGKGELKLVFHCLAGNRSQALRLEYRVKQLNRQQKLDLLQDPPARLSTLRQGTTKGD